MSKAKSVLVVDDDQEYRKILGEVLESEGCTVFTASDGQAALRMLGVVRPDLIVTDLMMPIMNGWDFCATLENTPGLSDIPLVVVSSVAKFHPLGRTRVLSKPVRLDTLIALLDIVDSP